jgi:NADH:ubiquinone oxidoreductase subunit F (NADH-binding)/NADH:ubiquinone oxidoreductase subunit E
VALLDVAIRSRTLSGAGPRVAGDLQTVLAGFPRERAALLPALHAVQHALGWLPEPALAAAAAHLRVPASEVHGVASHYPEFRLAPRGRHHVRVCTGVTCALLGGARLLETIAREQGVTPGTTGAERELTLERADCFFACSMAPLIEVDGACHGRVGIEDARDLRRWLHGAPPAAGDPPSPAAPGSTGPAGPLTAAGIAAGSATAFHAELVRRASGAAPPLTLLVQAGTCGRAAGAGDVLAALREAVHARGLGVSVVDGACNGMCYAAPVVEVRAPGAPRALVERVTPATAPRLLDALAAPTGDLARAGFAGLAWDERPWRGLAPAATHPFWRGQERVLLRRAGAIDPGDLGDALRAGAYGALARALDGGPEDVIARVKASGLEGRGGAYFPAALKWEACRRAAGEPKYVVLNGEEGEPGIFKDRHLMEGDPHRILEGVLLAAYAAGATRAILYIHGEADLAAERMARAVAGAEAAGIAGARMLGRDAGCRIEVRRGAGGFVLGEETALLESIEGRRAQPRTRPPFPVEAGLWGRPTVINNVETLAAVPDIVERGGEWFAGLGTAKAPGTKIFGLSGPIARPGVVEVRNGVSLRDLLEGAGGGAGAPIIGAVVGGPSGSVVPAALFDVPMEPRGQVSPGTGGVVAVPRGASIAGIVRILLEFNARESCGKCTPCREGLPRLLEALDGLDDAGARDRARALAETIQGASLCGLGQAAPLALLRALETFGEAFGTRA